MQGSTKRFLDAIIFDLDGVLTDTAEYHFQAWKRLADEEGIPFTREDNEHLRGVSRRESLLLLLKGRTLTEDQMVEWMDRKNGYYREMIHNVSSADLLPGAIPLLNEIRSAGLKIAIASASRNAQDVMNGLGIMDYVDALIDGNQIARAKPAPDLFVEAAHALDIPPGRCAVVEDALAGIEAANAAGMLAIALGPEERFGGAANLVVPDLSSLHLSNITHAATWRVVEDHFDPERQRTYESMLTQGNGYLGTRATFEERNPGDQQATMVHGLWDDAPIVFTELVNSPDWTDLAITVNGQRFSMQAAGISDYVRALDLRTGVLFRRLRWQPKESDIVLDLYFSRLPSLADPHAMAVNVRVDCVRGSADLNITTSLNAHIDNTGLLHLHVIEQVSDAEIAFVLVETRTSQKRLAMAMHTTTSDHETVISENDCPGCPGQRIRAHLNQGEALTVDKIVTVYTSRDTDQPLQAARSSVRQVAAEGSNILLANTSAWEEFWRDADVIIEGDDESQLAIRHAVYQLRIAASSTDEYVSIAAKTLSGFGYRGHAFWDTDIFILPFFIFTQPRIARNMLMYRWHTFEGARRNAQQQGLRGARFAWESAETGDEVTPPWVADPKDPHKLIRIWPGDIELHITADVAYAIWQYWQVTSDDEFMRDYGVPMILETAVYWADRAEPEGDHYSIRDVIGPDEYHDHVDNNVYTNWLVRWHLLKALELRDWLYQQDSEKAKALDKQLGLDEEAFAQWVDIADRLVILQDPQIALFEQFEGFFKRKEVNWPDYENRTKSMQLILGIEGANEHQVLKQPDVIILLCLFRDQFDPQTWQSNWDYYILRTDHSYGSSLGPAIHAWAAAEMGLLDAAYEHFLRAARTDLMDIRGNTAEGVHGASMGGLWQAVVFGFAGLRVKDGTYSTSPRLPAPWKRLTFHFYLRGERQTVDLHQEPVPSTTSNNTAGSTR